MATLGVLGSLVSQLGSTQMPQYNPQEVARAQQLLQSGRMGNETALLQLEELRRQQQTSEVERQFLREHPEFVLGQQGPSILGSLQMPGGGGAPAPGAITQQAFGPGGVTGPTQTIPSPPMPHANLGSPAGGMPGAPQSTIASLGPQPQAPPPPNPLMELMRRDPTAALAVQQRMQQQQDLTLKRQEQQLTMGTKVMEYLGRGAQGVTDQASLDAFRQEVARVHPQAAAQLPQTYAKEAMAPFIAKALDVHEAMTLQVQDLQAQAALMKARREGRSVDVDNQLRAMGVQPGQETPAQMREALQAVEEGKVRVSASHGTGQIVQTPQGFMRINPRTNQPEPIEAPGGGPLYPKPTAEEQRAASYGDRAKAAHDTAVALEEKGLTPSVWTKVGEALPFGLGNYLVGEDQQRYRQTVNQFAQAILRKESGAAISPTEYEMTEKTYFPQPGNSKAVIAQKRQERARLIQSMQEEGKQTGRQQAPGAGPTSQAPAGGKVVSRAALHEEARRRNVSPEQAEQMARQKGYEVR